MQAQTLHKVFPALGTINTLTLYGDCSRSAADRVRDRVLELHHRFSFFEPESDIGRINRSAGVRPVVVHPDTLNLLARALQCEKKTGGAFSVLSGPSAQLWREAIRSGQMPAEADIERCLDLGAAGGLILDEMDGTAGLQRAGQQLDLGGIAKGYAADEARRILLEEGVRSALINFGGTVVSIGKKRKIGVQSPFSTGASAGAVSVRNKAVVTSGVYERGAVLNGAGIHHIVDPRTGRPAESGLVSVTLTGDSVAELDALATALMVLGKDRARSVLRGSRIRAVMIGPDGAAECIGRPCFHRKSMVPQGEIVYG